MLDAWINEKFIEPLCRYYTIESTIIYGLILVVAVLGIYKVLRKTGVKIDRNFFIAMLPFIVYGGWTRALRDHNLYEGWYWCSPPIYILIFIIAFTSLLVGLWLQKKYKIKYHMFAFAVGGLLLLYNATLTNITNWGSFFFILALASGIGAILYGLHVWKPKIFSKINVGILSVHLLDASATFTALTFYGYYEQHVLPTFLINLSGPWIMFPLKFIVVGGVLWYIDKNGGNDKFFINLLKFVILVLGLPLGIRNMLTLSLLVV